jgi:hypothetical protein
MQRLLTLAAIVCVATVGCGAERASTPVACLEGPAFYEERHADGVLISECLTESQSGGDLANVGAAMLSAATELNGEAREQPGGAANVQLGYLLGAAQRGADGSEGIHDELVRRLAAAARYSPDNRSLTPAFQRAYRRGFDAGAQRG